MRQSNSSSRRRQSGFKKNSPKQMASVNKRKFQPKTDKKSPSVPLHTSEKESIRLNKYLSNAGICSRRDADVYIKAGNVTVSGTTRRYCKI